MQQAGQLPSGHVFKVRRISVMPIFTAAPVTATDLLDWMNWSNNAVLDFISINKTMLTLPIKRFTAGAGPQAATSGAAAADYVYTNGVPDPRALFSLKPEYIQINESETFRVVVTLINATPANIVTTFNVCISLDGILWRPIQ
jgi:hypothetical protein